VADAVVVMPGADLAMVMVAMPRTRVGGGGDGGHGGGGDQHGNDSFHWFSSYWALQGAASFLDGAIKLNGTQ